MICDVCSKKLPSSNYEEKLEVKDVSGENNIEISGIMPKGTEAYVEKVETEEAFEMIRNFKTDALKEDIVDAFDISLNNVSGEYQPGENGRSVNVRIDHLNLDSSENYALLHVNDNNEVEVVDMNIINENEIEFKAIHFSTYIVISAGIYEITFESAGVGEHFKILDDNNEMIVNNQEMASTSFKFYVEPEVGYGISSITTNPSLSSTYWNTYGSVSRRCGEFKTLNNNVTVTINVVGKPTITNYSTIEKVNIGDSVAFTVEAENATTYEWQYKQGYYGAWESASGVGSGYNTQTLTISEVKSTYSSYFFRCLVGNQYYDGGTRTATGTYGLAIVEDPIVSEPITLKVLGVNVSLEGDTILNSDLTADISVTPSENTTYSIQWYMNTVNSTEGGTPIENATSNTLHITSDMNNMYIYIEVTGHNPDYDDRVGKAITPKKVEKGLVPILMERDNVDYAIGAATRYEGSYSSFTSNNISLIEILDVLKDDVPTENIVATWDVSYHNDGSVTAWVQKIADTQPMYTLYIGGEGGVIAPENCSNLFANYGYCETVERAWNLNTDNTTNMSGMFRDCRIMYELNIKKLSTQKVTNMQYMFANCENLVVLVPGVNFDKINDVDMFKNCPASILTKRTTPMTLMTTNQITNGNRMVPPSEEDAETYKTTAGYIEVYGEDNIIPMLTLIGDKNISLSVGEEYEEPGFMIAGFTVDDEAGYNACIRYGLDVVVPPTIEVIEEDGSRTKVAKIDTVDVAEYEITYSLIFNDYADPNAEEIEIMNTHRRVTVGFKNIADSDITASLSQTTYEYDGTLRTPTVTVMYNGSPLVKDTDYSITYVDNDKAGAASVVIAGIGNYAGTRTLNFMINPRAITVKSNDATKSYDETPLTCTDYTITAGSLISGHTVVITTSGAQTEVGSSENTISRVVVRDANGIDASAGYTITTAAGTLTVTKPLTVDFDITLGTSTYVYDGTAKEPTVTVKVAGTEITAGTDYIVNYSNNKNAGDATVTITGQGTYAGSIGSKTFTITKRAITLTAGSSSKIYNGTALINGNVTVTGGLGVNHVLTASTSGTITSVGSVENTITTYVIRDEGGNDVTANYEIETATGTLTITPATITGSVNITGTAKYGEQLMAEVVNVSPSDCTLTYKWYSNEAASTEGGTEITGATSATLEIGDGLTGKYIYVVATATKENYTTATFSNVSAQVAKADGTISYGTTTVNKSYGDASYTNNTLSKTGDGTVSFASSNTGVATVDASTGAVTIVGTGSTTITATVVDGTNYTYATKTATYALNVSNLEITGSVSITGTNTYLQTLSVDTSLVVPTGCELAYKWYRNTSDSTTGGSLISGATSSTYTLSSEDVGKYIYVIVTANKTNYTSKDLSDITDATNNTTAKVSKAEASISYATASVNQTFGDAAFTNTLTKTGDGTLSYVSSNTGVAEVNATTGEVTIVGVGSTTITATVVDGTNYTYPVKTATYTLNVANAEITGEVKVTGTNTYLQTLSVDTSLIVPTGCELTYKWYRNTSDNTTGGSLISGATSSTYTLSSEDVGKYIYVVITASKTNYNSKDLSDITDAVNNATAPVAKASANISYATTSVSKTFGDAAFTNTLTNTGDGTVSFESSNTGVATVNTTTGEVTIVGNGSTTITATALDGTNYTYPVKTATYTVTVGSKSLTDTSIIAELSATSFDYTGADIEPTVTVKDASTPLTLGQDYEVTYSDNKNNGKATVTITGKGNYKDSIELNFMINRIATTVKAKDATKEYDGTALTKNEYEITSGTLISGHIVDATITGSQTDVGSSTNTLVSVVIKDAGGNDVSANYIIEKADGTLTVTAADSVDFDITLLSDTFTYDGTAKEPTATVYVGTTLLTKGTDYTVSYSNNINASTAATVTITGKGNYAGSTGSKAFTISQRAIEITAGSSSRTYDGTALTNGEATVTSDTKLVTGHTLTVSNTGTITNVGSTSNTITSCTIMSGTDNVTSNYAVTTKAGTLEILPATITGSVNITGTAKYGELLTAEVANVSPSDCILTYKWYSNDTASTENGEEISGATSTTYTIGNNLIGKYIYVEVTATKSNYTTAIFKGISNAVVKADITPTVSMTNYEFGGTKSTPSVSGNTENGTETYYYNTTNSNANGTAWSTVANSESLNVGTYYMYAVVDETANYNGATTPAVEFKVNPKVVTLNVVVSGDPFIYDGSAKEPTVTVKDGEKTLTKDVDYEVSYSNNTNVGTATVTVTGKGNYAGSNGEASFEIAKADRTITMNDTLNLVYGANENVTFTYTGEDVTATAVSGTTSVVTVSMTDGTQGGTVAVNAVGNGTSVVTVNVPASTNYNEASKTVTVTVDKKNIGTSLDITSSLGATQVTYDGTAQMPIVTVKDGEKVLVKDTDYEVTYSNNINADTAALVTITGIGNYTGTRTETFIINARAITVKAKDATKEYDGSALTCNETQITSGSLATGHSIVATITGSQTDVGSSTNTLNSVSVKDGGNNNVSANYIITKENGTLTVTVPGSVTFDITLSNNTYTYDGTAKEPTATVKVGATTLHENTDYEVSYSNNLNAGTGATVTITGKGNYEGSIGNKTFTIAKRHITLVAGSKSKAYDGIPLTYGVVNVSGENVATGDTLTATASGTITNVGTADNIVSTYSIMRGEVNVTDMNYVVETVKGTLTITNAAIEGSVTVLGNAIYDEFLTANVTINVNDCELSYKWYSNTTNSTEGGSIISGATNSTYKIGDNLVGKYIYVEVTASKDNYASTTFKGISAVVEKADINPTVNMEGYEYAGTKSTPSVSGNTENGTVTYYYNTTNSNTNGTLWNTVTNSESLDVGTYYMYAVIGETANYNGATTPTKAFEVTNVGETTFDITISGDSFIYNGQAQEPEVKVKVGDKELAPNVDYTVSYENNENAGEAKVIITGKGNYLNSTAEETFTINKRRIELKAGSANKEYDGAPLTSSEIVTVSGSLVSGHVLSASTSGSITNVGTVENTISSYRISAGGTDVTSNYIVIVIPGTLEITARPITIKPKDITKVYDGLPLVASGDDVEIVSGTKVSGDIITITTEGSQTNAGTSDSSIKTVLIKNTTNVDVTNNYNITKATGKLTVTKAEPEFNISISGESKITVVNGNTFEITYTKEGDGVVTVASNNACMTIEEKNGSKIIIAGVGVGTAKATITLGEGTNYTSKVIELDVEVVEANYSITKDSKTTYYNKLEDAVKDGGTITAIKDIVDTSENIVIDSMTTINLNGHEVKLNVPVEVEEGGTLIIPSDNGGKLIVNSGTAIVVDAGGALIVGNSEGKISDSPRIEGNTYAINGNVTFNSGTLVGSNQPPYSGGNVSTNRAFAEVVTSKSGDKYIAQIHTETIPPEVTITQTPTTPTNGDVILTIRVTDANGIKSATYTVEGVTEDLDINASGYATITVHENAKYIITAEDNAGNVTEKEHEVTNIDRVAGEVIRAEIVGANNNVVDSVGVIITNFEVSGDDIKSIMISNSDTPSGSWMPYSNNMKAPWILDGSNGNGEKKVYIWVKDEAGNVSDEPYVLTVTLKAKLIGSDNNKVTLSIAAVDRNFKSSNLTVDGIKLKAGGNALTYATIGLNKVPGEYINLEKTGEKYEITLVNVKGNGKITIDVDAETAVDMAGNKNDATTLESDISVDTNAPEISVTEQNKISVVDGEDNLLAVTINGVVVNESEGYYGEAVNGNIIKAYDRAGNVKTYTVSK